MPLALRLNDQLGGIVVVGASWLALLETENLL